MVNSFVVDPQVACPGEQVVVRWDVTGAARLAIVTGTKAPTPEQIMASEQPVPSKETRSVAVGETTTFVLRAVDANQAKAPWQGLQVVDVPVALETKAVNTTCTGATCRGDFAIHAMPGTAKVVRLSAPMRNQHGETTPARVCVTHDALQAACIEAGASLDTSVAADGLWTLQTTLPSPAAATPPPRLTIMVQFGCP